MTIKQKLKYSLYKIIRLLILLFGLFDKKYYEKKLIEKNYKSDD